MLRVPRIGAVFFGAEELDAAQLGVALVNAGQDDGRVAIPVRSVYQIFGEAF